MLTDNNGLKFYKVALHLHSTLSDGRKSPSEIAKAFKADGFDAIALTDHWYYGKEQTIEGLNIISGCEYNLGPNEATMHIVGLGMECDPKIPSNSSRQDVVNQINKCGGIAVLAHPAWSLNTIDEAKALKGIFATEIYNSVSEQGQSLRAYSDHFVDLCARAGLDYGIFATDDAHYYEGIDDRKGFVMVKAESSSAADIVKAIKKGDFYASQGPHLDVKLKSKKLIVNCSPCSLIAVLTNSAWGPNKTLRSDNSTYFEYDFAENDSWARVEVRDKFGKRAWSNIFRI